MALEDFFTWGSGGRKMTPDQLAAERQALAVMQAREGDTSPVAHWSQGLGRVVNALAGNYRESKADKAEAAGIAQGKAAMDPVLAALMGGGSGGGYTAGGGASGGTWTPAPPPPSATATPGMEGGLGFGASVPAMPAPSAGGLSFGAQPMTPQQMIIAGAEARGLNPIDVATAISYETGGKFDPLISGPTTQWGTHRGLIQFGEPQAKQYGADFSSPEAAMKSQLDPETGAVWNYLDGVGVQPGMGLDNIYSAINAGAPGRFNASDANNGGAPGTVADKVAGMGGHRQKAAEFLGGTWTPNPDAGGGNPVTMSTSGQPAAPQGDIISLLMAAQADPWARKQYGPVIDALMGSELSSRAQAQDPMYQLGLQKAQLEVDAMRNPAAPKPIEVGGVLLDPTTFQPIFDSRSPDAPKQGFRIATPQEAKAYGSTAGQFGPDGRFYPVDVPQGMTIESDGAGGFRMVQGPAGTEKPFTEAQSKDVVFGTRAQGALDVLDPIAGELTSRTQRAAEFDPTGLARGAMQSDQFQIAKNAGDEFLQALLRKDSGAAITPSEQSLYGVTYLPQPGDNEALLEAKKAARRRAVTAIQAGMNPAQIVAQEKALASGGDVAVPTTDKTPLSIKRRRWNPEKGAFE